MAKQQHQQAVGMVFLMHAVPVEAGGFVVPIFIFQIAVIIVILQLSVNTHVCMHAGRALREASSVQRF